MSESIMTHSASLRSLPVPNAPISVRIGTRDDIGFIDGLQKQYSKALGFFPRAQLEGYIDNGWVLIAEMNGVPVGYVASRDRYLKRDELGVIYQMCVSPSAQRGLVGATLIKAMFERSAYGCRLYCCWCAQDLAANRFWESLGFVPIAFRGGSEKKSRVHIFWQKRIRANDHTTPWWFPAKTEGGALREDRIVLPIPPGLRWSDAMPVMVAAPMKKVEKQKMLPGTKAGPKVPTPRPRAGMQFGRPSAKPTVEEAKAAPAKVDREKTNRVASPCESSKVDPKLIAAARELRDRYLEQVNAEPITTTGGKYDVTKAIEDRAQPITVEVVAPKQLAA
jgi:hypothetical protein